MTTRSYHGNPSAITDRRRRIVKLDWKWSLGFWQQYGLETSRSSVEDVVGFRLTGVLPKNITSVLVAWCSARLARQRNKAIAICVATLTEISVGEVHEPVWNNSVALHSTLGWPKVRASPVKKQTPFGLSDRIVKQFGVWEVENWLCE